MIRMKKALSRREQEAYLLSKIGNPVKFTYPEGEHLIGELIDRSAFLTGEDNLVAYWMVMDLIKFEGYEENWIRLSYYRYRKKERNWVFAGQTSISDTIGSLAESFVKAVKEKEWVRLLFREVCRVCEKELT